jgi:hypothetical protein
MNNHGSFMSKNITISDEVYRRLKREKGDRSFSDVIAATLDSGGDIADVAGQEILDPGTYESVCGDIGRLSDDILD